MRHPKAVAENPGDWLPWNYRETLVRQAAASVALILIPLQQSFATHACRKLTTQLTLPASPECEWRIELNVGVSPANNIALVLGGSTSNRSKRDSTKSRRADRPRHIDAVTHVETREVAH